MHTGSPEGTRDLAQTRLDNALALFEEFVRTTARHADAATLRGLERRFAERIDIQPSYWSQIKSRSRQIGERLARQFEQRCLKPVGWMDQPHTGAAMAATGAPSNSISAADTQPGAATAQPLAAARESTPRDDDEKFIVGLVLTYYRRHPQRARARLLDLLGEVLTPVSSPPPPPPFAHTPLSAAAEDAQALWLKSQKGVAPLKRKK